MLSVKYVSLVTELASLIQKHKELEEISKSAEFDLKWRLSELFKSVKESDEQKFIDLSGMHGHLITTAEKKVLAKISEKEETEQEEIPRQLSGIIETDKKNVDKVWAKSLYKRAVRRCHPDTLKLVDEDFKSELTRLYKTITESYENDNLDILMVESYKLFVKPKEVIKDQIEILEISKKSYNKKIKRLLVSQGYTWSKFNDALKEDFLVDLMKQHGVRFVEKEKVKEILRRKVNSRKVGQKPKNILRERVKNKK